MRVRSVRLLATALAASILGAGAQISIAQEASKAEAPLAETELREALAGKIFEPLRTDSPFIFGQEFCRSGNWFGAHHRVDTMGKYEVRQDLFCVNESGSQSCYQLFRTADGVRFHSTNGPSAGLDAFYKVKDAHC
jgi:hypothetical protein